jgi:predicted MFS family arabinose efflux permease
MTTHQKAIVAILAFLQFTVMVDFMILSPLGAMLLDELHIDTKQFGFLVSAYAVSAGISSFVSASYLDKFDRKKLVLFFYTGFISGTALCGVAPSYEFLLGARILTGVFGGVLASLSMAIVVDLFPLAMRGRAMGSMMTSYAAAQVVGLPAGLALSNAWGWHAPFLVIAGIGAVVGVAIAFVLRPIDAHLKHNSDDPAKPNALVHLVRVATKPAYLRVFATTILLSSGFMLMPLLSAFFVNNLHVDIEQLPIIFLITGIATFFMGPIAGKLADTMGKLVMFTAGTLLTAVVYVVWANLAGPTALWIVVAVNVLMFAANSLRMIAAGALTSAVPALPERGAFMSLNSSLQQLTGGVASALGGFIVVVQPDGSLARFDTLCYVVVAAVVVALLPIWIIDRAVKSQAA